MNITLPEVIAECLNNDVDFEVWNGQTTTHGSPIRKQMLVSPVGQPEVLINFGDNKHGNRVVASYLTRNHVPVRMEDVMAVIRENTTTRPWKRDIAETAEKEISYPELRLKGDKVQISEAVVKEATGTGYVLSITDFYGTASGEFFSRESEMGLIVDHDDDTIKEGDTLTFTGIYVYPNKVRIVPEA